MTQCPLQIDAKTILMYFKRGIFMEKNTFPVIFLLLLLSSVTIVQGQNFPDPNNNNPRGRAVMISQPIAISEAKNLPNDSWVVVTGRIVNTLPGGRQYTFRDHSGEISVDIGPKEWRGLSVDASDRVTIYGELKIRRGHTLIRVYAIRRIEE